MKKQTMRRYLSGLFLYLAISGIPIGVKAQSAVEAAGPAGDTEEPPPVPEKERADSRGADDGEAQGTEDGGDAPSETAPENQTASENPPHAEVSTAPPPEKPETPTTEGDGAEGEPADEDGAVPIDLDGEEAVDLDALSDSQEETPSEAQGHGHGGHGKGGIHLPKFKLLFDFLVEYELETNKFGFSKDHAYVVLEMDATPWLTFRTDVSVSPTFFELNFHIGSSMDLNLGKVVVPFGQNTWHHLIGGRVDMASLFLPTIWADYGISFEHRAYDGEHVSFAYALYVVNGFQAATDDYGNPFPSRSAGQLDDNNTMKGVGARPTLYIDFFKLTVGTSWYFDAWQENNKGKMLYYGVDLDFGYGFIPVPGLKNLRLRAEAAWGEIDLPGQNYYEGIIEYGSRRAGYNFEASYKVLPMLTLRYREGYLNSDSRFRDAGDLLVHEPSVITRLGPVLFFLTAQFLDPIAKDSEIEREEYSKLLFRVLFRY
jgi:hypothetical protein